jgi:selenocysteine lyase/cysteine desulfurase
MLTCQKHLFSLPDDITYLNCAYMGPLPEPVEMAGYQGVARKTLPYEITVPEFFEPSENLQCLFAELIHADDPGRVALMPSVSYGIANVARNIRLTPGQKIVTVDEVFPSNYYSWKRLADENRALLQVVKAPLRLTGRGREWNEKILEAIDYQTVAVALPHVHWADGTLFDLVAIRQRSREVGALLIIDGTQSVGALPFDAGEIQPDALLVAGYKWLLGPYGFGLAYYGPYFDDGTPIEENWINRLHSERFENLVNYQPAYRPGAQRYSVGESSQFVAVPMLTAALRLILDWGVENIQTYCRELTQPHLERLSEMGFWMEDARWRGSHLFGVRLPENVDIAMLKNEAAARKVFVSFRGDAVRISPHLYNNEYDMEQLINIFSDL